MFKKNWLSTSIAISKILKASLRRLYTFNLYMTPIIAKEQNSDLILKSLAGIIWGEDKEMFLATYKAATGRSLITQHRYGSLDVPPTFHINNF